ncbi:heterokaryon incompatibility protein-domain-containing protein [Achaetomium macrosporum]|uniref:Heterokaryon incompatibility protein-domain-containing protein n=1 Tax=Achaetomium macrosporum TaxID=79813 RepID=A0AAN7C0L3_9PEZI|nr:heterokaryon incompatibility protein-domain-containing protein [Achaetomium macrosporum]
MATLHALKAYTFPPKPLSAQSLIDALTGRNSMDEIERYVMPWNDPNLLANIPSIFTIDLRQGSAFSNDNTYKLLCKCRTCCWLRDMEYECTRPRFCVRTIEDHDDLRFYVKREIQWPEDIATAEARGGGGADDELHADRPGPPGETNDETSSWETVTDEDGDSICQYGQAMMMCLDFDADGSPPTSNARLHLMLNLLDGVTMDDTFHIRASSEDDHSAQNFKPHIAGVIADPSCDESWDKARAWLAECQHDHEPCKGRDRQATSNESWPARLVDVGDHGDAIVRLVPRKHLSSESVAAGYLALSYCWGVPEQETSTSTANLESRCAKVFSVHGQPATIQDALRVTRELGFRHIWIDSICIIQDDASDKASEIARMDKIYQHAKLLVSDASPPPRLTAS